LLKDEVLSELAAKANVAQFASFAPDLTVRHAWIRGVPEGRRPRSALEAVEKLLAVAPEGTVNVRSFAPNGSAGQEFLYALGRGGDVLSALQRLGAAGLYTIVNETIDVEDGGVSGVAFGGALEFAPADTPRCVEKPGVASLPWRVGFRILATVYGFQPALTDEPDVRVEFSLHPVRRGYLNDHTVVWEREALGGIRFHPEITWPNRFSRWIGDKAFGLVVAAALDLPVPRTTVIGRRVAPFTFGDSTGTAEPWIRTCPHEQDPGRFTTSRGWLDPFRLLQKEDRDGERVASIAAQEGVNALYSGALLTDATGQPVVEGMAGYGQDFMLGKERAPLPAEVCQAVLKLYDRASAALGAIRFEWVYDGRKVWVVQLHRGISPSRGLTVYPGDARSFEEFDATKGIEALRSLVEEAARAGKGIVLRGKVGITSHLADLLRRRQIPSRIEPGRAPVEENTSAVGRRE
jgi:hypothetical protein